MAPAPANESVAMMSPFFTTSSSAAPLSERDCNGSFACAPAFRAHTTLTCAMRRGASFLDADDACLAFSDKTSFLIPEDSYLPDQENCAAVPSCGAAAAFGRVPCCPYPSTGAGFSSFPPTHTGAIAIASAAAARPRMPTPFLDTPAFGVLSGEEEFAAAAVCFEKAVQALEAVERPTGFRGAVMTCQQANPDLQQGSSPTASDVAIPSPFEAGSCGPLQPMLDLMMLQPQHGQPRRVSSLSPSPPAAMDWAVPVIPYEQSDVAPSSCDGVDYPCAAEAVSPGCWMQPPEVLAAAAAAAAAVAATAQEPGISAAERMAAAGPSYYDGVTDTLTGMIMAFDGVIPAAPATAAPPLPPVVKAFHHKTGGPCDHCGATESPQWRRGPPAKPMLCNACGTRFRRTNQLNPAAALSPAGRAAAAAAASAAAKRNSAAKRDPPYIASASSKRGRFLAAYY